MMPGTVKASMAALVLATLLVQPVATAAQTSGADVGRKAGEMAEAIRDYTVERKDEAVAQGKKLVAELDRQIADLQAKAEKSAGAAKAKSEAALKDLKAKREVASRKLDDLGKAAGASWDAAKHGFADAFRDLRKAYDEAVSAFRN